MTEPLTDEEIAALAHAWEIDDAAPLLEDHEGVERPIYMHDILATIADLKRLLEMANGCLNMVAERLEALGCACKEQHVRAETPPMMYPEWIDCVISARIAERDRRIEAAEELIATMERYPGEAHGADEWYCERMEKDIAAYRDAYPAKKGE